MRNHYIHKYNTLRHIFLSAAYSELMCLDSSNFRAQGVWYGPRASLSERQPWERERAEQTP